MVRSLQNIQGPKTTEPLQSQNIHGDQSFADALGIKLSKHALKRLMQRGIPFDQQIAQTLSKGIDQAEQKGGKDALLMLEDSAYIVGVAKRQLITAFKVNDMGKVVTNIDTAVILSRDEE